MAQIARLILKLRDFVRNIGAMRGVALRNSHPHPISDRMYYAPRYSPEKPGMPVLGYFTVVGAALLGLIFAADAYMPRTQQLSFVSNLDGLPAAYKGEPAHVPAAAPHIAPMPVVAETTGSAGGLALAAAAEAPKPPPTLAAAPVAQPAAKPVKHKVARRQHREYQEDNFGSFGRQEFGFGREPSWRDSWASGAFEQREQRSRRSASRSGGDFRSGNDFWRFR